MNVIPKLTQLSSRVWRILGCNPGPMTLQGTNIYLIGTGSKRVLVEAGQDGFPEYVQNLQTLLQEQKVSIESLVITHWHQDHIGALPDLQNVLKGTSPSNSLPTLYKFPRLEPRDGPTEPNIPESYTLVPLQDNQVIKTEGASLRVVFTPGHTSDHAVLYLEEDQSLFSGDCILGEGTTVFEDLKDYMSSLEKIQELKPVRIYPGHGPVVEDPLDKIRYYIEHRIQRENQILSCLAESKWPLSPIKIVKRIYAETPAHLHPAAEVNVRHHLKKLIKEERVHRREDTFYIPPPHPSKV